MSRVGELVWRKFAAYSNPLHERRRFTREMALRALADILMVNAALAIALTLHYVWSVSVEENVASARGAFLTSATSYLGTAWLLTAISMVVFYGSGFYTYGRAYRGRYKVVVIMQAVSWSYAIFAILLLLLRAIVPFPLSALLLAWFLTIIFMAGARLLFVLWWNSLDAEHHYPPLHSTRTQVRNVLVIGGAGYIGSALTSRLLELGYHVRVLDLLLYGDEAIAKFYGHPRFELVRGDLRHIDTVVSAVRGMDAVVHLGAIVGDSACEVCEDLTVEINLQATRTIAEVSKGLGVSRFVFASTCSVYGASDEILDERSALCPLSLYARTKMASEKVLLSLADALFAPIILRFGTIYGLSGRPRFDLVVNLLAAKAIEDGEVGIFGGQQWRPLVHVKDVAEAIVLTLQAPRANVCGQVFNVGSNEQNYQISDLGRIIQEMLPSARVVTQPQEDNRNYRVRFDKIRRRLNFQPRYTVRDGVSEIIQAFAVGTITDYQDPQYNNFTFLKQHGELQRVLLEDSRDRDGIQLLSMSSVPVASVPTQSPHSDAGGQMADAGGQAHVHLELLAQRVV